MDDNEYSFSNYLKYSWNYANNYMNYENELIKLNNIKDDKIIEYTNKFMLENNDYATSKKLAYNCLKYSVTLKNQNIKLEKLKNNLYESEAIYNIYYKIFNLQQTSS
jgi:hypothetical protein